MILFSLLYFQDNSLSSFYWINSHRECNFDLFEHLSTNIFTLMEKELYKLYFKQRYQMKSHVIFSFCLHLFTNYVNEKLYDQIIPHLISDNQDGDVSRYIIRFESLFFIYLCDRKCRNSFQQTNWNKMITTIAEA